MSESQQPHSAPGDSTAPPVQHPPEAPETKQLGLLAQLPDKTALLAASEKLRDAGYKKIDAFTPYPIHGIDQALGAKPSMIPWVVLLGGLAGCVGGLGMQWYMNAFEANIPLSGYRFNISGKPFFSLPANIPITFEATILMASFAAFFSVLIFNRLPQLSNPLFSSERFRSVTTDGLFLFVDSKDPNFNVQETEALLSSSGAESVESIEEPVASTPMPSFVFGAITIATVVALVPPLWIAAAATGASETPRYSIWWDMDYQPKFKPQTVSSFFADKRAMRLAVAGTVARGGLREDVRYYYGIEPGEDVPAQATLGVRTEFALPEEPAVPAGEEVAGEQPPSSEQPSGGEQTPSDGAAPDADPALPPEPAWVTEIPVSVSAAMMERGQQRFNIYCATCHGRDGLGNGLVSQRATSLQQPTWVPPTDLHSDLVVDQPVGKLYNTISNGIRNMPPYRSQIPVEDRWAIVLYLRALQRSQDASIEDVPEAQRRELNQLAATQAGQPAGSQGSSTDGSPGAGAADAAQQ